MKTLAQPTSQLGRKAHRILGTTTAAVAVATGVGVMGTATEAQADIVYSGPVNIVIPDNIDGIYMNLVTGATGVTPPAGWDINPYTATAGANSGFHLWGFTTTTWFNPSGTIGNAAGYILANGTSIGPGPNFFRPGGGTNLNTAVTLNAANLFGVQFTNENGGGTHFAWVQITFGATVGDRRITAYAYDNVAGTSIPAGAIPEPSTFAILAAGAAGLMALRRFRRPQ